MSVTFCRCHIPPVFEQGKGCQHLVNLPHGETGLHVISVWHPMLLSYHYIKMSSEGVTLYVFMIDLPSAVYLYVLKPPKLFSDIKDGVNVEN